MNARKPAYEDLKKRLIQLEQQIETCQLQMDAAKRMEVEHKQLETILRESEEHLTRAQQIAHLGSWELDLGKNKLTWSDETYRIFGLQPQEFVATYKAFLDKVHPQDRTLVDAAYSDSVQQGKDTYEIEHRIIRSTTGEIRWVHEKCEHLRNARGKIIRSIGMVLDITDQKRTELQQELMASILRILNRGSDDLTELIRQILRLIRESDGFDAVGLRIRQGNDFPFYEHSGFSDGFVRRENSLLHKLDDGAIALDQDEKPVLECMCGLVLSGKVDHNLPFFTEGGSFWTNSSSEILAIPKATDPRINPRNRCIERGYQSIALIPVRSGQEIIGLIHLNARNENRLNLDLVRFYEGLGDQIGLSLRRKRLLEELKSLNEFLEHRVVERTAEIERRSEQLRQLAAELTQAEQRERQRLAQILHDGLQQILVGAKFRLASIVRSKDLKTTIAEVADILDEAIETSRSLTAELSPPILHQSGLIAALEWLARWMHEKHGLEVNLFARKISLPQKDVAVFLFQAVRELLLNVIKHSGVHSARMQVTQRDSELHITVSDEGSGFDQRQLRVAGGKSGGFGLFSLSERINMLGGSMTIVSAPGGGSRIRLITPIPKTRPETKTSSLDEQTQVSVGIYPEADFDATASEGNIRIVLVDDHILMRQGLAGLLRSEPDMEIVGEASDGESAVNLIREIKPHVVLMDVSMPGMNGIQATRIIHSELPDIRIIGLSMFQEGEQAEDMREAGAIDYLTKSGPSAAMIAAIRNCVQTPKKLPKIKNPRKKVSTQHKKSLEPE